MKQGSQPPAWISVWIKLSHQLLDDNAVLGNRKCMRTMGLAIPPGDPRKPVGNVFNLDIQR